MIIHLKPDITAEKAEALARQHQSVCFRDNGHTVLVTPSKVKELPGDLKELVEKHFVADSDIQLADRRYMDHTREIDFGTVKTGGSTGNTVMIAGPCSVESEEQIMQCAGLLNKHGLRFIRGGCFKPRTSPYSFQGLGVDGLKLLAAVREQYGFKVVTEVRDASHVQDVIEYADVVQIGAKAMYDHGILRACGAIRKPVLLKRGFGTTLQEFVQAAEFVLSGGNPNVMLCERGIRTFETKTRFTLDLCGVAFLKEYTNLPVVLDPSHAMGHAYGVADLTRACAAMGVDGLLVEVHPDPSVALSDASQQLTFEQFETLLDSVKPVAAAVNRKIV